MMKRINLNFLAVTMVYIMSWLIIFSCGVSGISIVKNGSSRAVISVPGNASKQVNDAADILSEYIEKSTGAKLTVETDGNDKKKVTIHVGEDDFTKSLNLDLKDIDIERVIFMGTEPALDLELPALAEALHQKFNCYNIILTNGLKLIDLEHIDEVIFSIKALSEGLHRDYTGKSNKVIFRNFIAIYGSGKRLQAETVLIPDYIDKYEVERIAGFIGGVDSNIPLRIDAYFPVGDNPWRAATAMEVEAAAKLAKKHLIKVNCLTLEMKRIGDKSVRIF